jgi:hypothetical protein
VQDDQHSRAWFGRCLRTLIDNFSAAALGSSLWVNAIDVAAQVTGSVGSVLLPIRGHIPTLPVSDLVSELLAIYSPRRLI